MSSDERGVNELRERVVELTTILHRVETLISKLSEISSNLSLLVNTHSHKIDSLNAQQTNDRLEHRHALAKVEKSIDEINQKLNKIDEIATNSQLNRASIQEIQGDLDDLRLDMEKNYVRKESFETVKKIVYGSVAAIITAVGGAILNLVLK